MTTKGLEFEVIQESGGSYAATCVDKDIRARGIDLKEFHANLTEAIATYYGDEAKPNPEDVKLIIYKEEEE